MFCTHFVGNPGLRQSRQFGRAVAAVGAYRARRLDFGRNAVPGRRSNAGFRWVSFVSVCLVRFRRSHEAANATLTAVHSVHRTLMANRRALGKRS
jgi:hypothetical protein